MNNLQIDNRLKVRTPRSYRSIRNKLNDLTTTDTCNRSLVKMNFNQGKPFLTVVTFI